MPGHYGMKMTKKTVKKSPSNAIMAVGKSSKAVKLPGMPKKAKPKMM
jgi:hypothetical protein